MSSDIAAVILAAGKGTRMRSELPKVLHCILGRPLIHFPVRLAIELRAARTVVVVGHGRAAVEQAVSEILPDARFAVQEVQRGTADAVSVAAEATLGSRDVLILSGDVPGLQVATVQAMVSARTQANSPLAVLGFEPGDATGYGRMELDDRGRLMGIVEHRDASPEQREIRVCNAGIYLVDRDFLFGALSRVTDSNSQGELYLTDIASMAAEAGQAAAVVITSPEEVEGVNDRAQLAAISARIQAARNAELMRSGVTMLAPERTWVELDATVAPDAVLHPDVMLRGSTQVGSGATIGQGCHLTDSSVAAHATLLPYCVLSEAVVGEGAAVGPFAHLRPGTELSENTKVGNFVETKKAKLGPGSKASHLTYLGDCTLGAEVNVGAGTITCNYDGVSKHQTRVGDRVFIGSNTAIVAPVTIGEEAVIGAGTTVTKNVPAGALALSRAPQTDVEGWASRRGPHARKKAQKKRQKED